MFDERYSRTGQRERCSKDVKYWEMVSRHAGGILLFLFLIACAGCGGSSSGSGFGSPSGAVSAPLLRNSSQHAEGQGWRRTDCFICHPLVKLADIHKRRPAVANSLNALGVNAVQACMACHDTNGLSAEEGGIRRCLICHGDADVWSKTASSLAVSSGDFQKTNQHDITGSGTLNDAACITCHAWSDMNGVFDLSVDLTNFGTSYAAVNDFCLSCHDVNGAAGIVPPSLASNPYLDPARTIFTDISRTFLGSGATEADRKSTADIHGFADGGPQLFAFFRTGYSNGMVLQCTECHFVHSSVNPYLITETGNNPLFTPAGILGVAPRLDPSDPDYAAVTQAQVRVTTNRFNQLCAVCHTNPAGDDAGNGLKEVAHRGFTLTDCTDCHYHGAGYGPSRNSRLF